jgi:hypothetical protein
MNVGGGKRVYHINRNASANTSSQIVLARSRPWMIPAPSAYRGPSALSLRGGAGSIWGAANGSLCNTVPIRQSYHSPGARQGDEGARAGQIHSALVKH